MDTIGLDLGTGALKGVRWNASRGVTAQASRRVVPNYPAPGRVELDAEAYLALVLDLIGELASKDGDPVEAISWDSASGNTVLCDEESRPLRPAISWLDNRLPEWKPPEDWNVRQVVGWPAISTFPLMHLEYYRRTEPQVLAEAQITMLNELLSWRLTGRRGLDRSSATPFYLANQNTGKYEPAYLEHYRITEAQLPPLINTGDCIGTLKAEYVCGSLSTSTRIVAGSFDHPSGARAAGITQPGDLLLSCGTSWVGFHPIATREDALPRELCDPFQSAAGGCWGAMFSVSSIGLEIERFVCERYGDDGGRYERFNEEGKKEGTPAAELMDDVVQRFKVKLGDRHFNRVVMIGGPSEGEAWAGHIESGLGIKPERCRYRNYSCAAGAAMIAAGKE